jgi:hypothetical protein
MFTQLQPLKNVDQFIKGLFSDPGSKAVTTYDGKNEIIDNPVLFYQAVNLYLDYMVLPEKKFKKITNFDQEIKTLLKLLTPANKFDRYLRPALCNLYYNQAKREITGTNAQIIWTYQSYHELGSENTFISTDKLGNIILTPESNFDGGKYPDYNAVFPIFNDNDEKFHLNELLIDRLYYFVKLAKICGLKVPNVKVGKCTFNAYLLINLIEAFKVSLSGYNFILHTPGVNRGAYVYVNDQKYKGLIMPIIENDPLLTYKLI